ncbi:hypothetical protein Egran_04209 [Elaphomyces granulatus]|uniref:Rho-GAP domain-containing protein n=1 Tax=Elaphomyces granulatus TaxID=519963 RepID=A0A232LVG1_9EURO|nr:hypothetical protein Egran_04209 [Elaphomyces granulatus]
MATGSAQSAPAHHTPLPFHPTHIHRPQPDSAPTPPLKRDLIGWWKQFKRNGRKEDEKGQQRGIFGVPLNVSIKYANVAISLTNANGESFIYGYVPIVVAKCGVFLKEKATDVEGIFRLNGSARRIKDLQEIFDSPERYGKGLDWSGYTVHDAANVLRRYLNQLPEPIVPLNFYERFRDPLRHHQAQAVGDMDARGSEKGDFDPQQAVAAYQQFIRELPSLNQQLLLYILDLLAVFASKSDQNRMTAGNLAAIFQPGILSHPTHDMAPEEYKLSQDVLIFLIENQDHFLFGMNGPAADAQTVKGRAAAPLGPRSNLRRSASNASGGADSLRKYETLRRNVSVSSKNSRHSRTAQSPSTPTSNMGVHRSNTVPSQKSPALPSSRLGRAAEPATPTSAGLAPPSDTHRTSRAGSRTPSRSPPVHYAAVAVVQYAAEPPATTATVAVATPNRPTPPTPAGTSSSSSPPNVITHTKERKLSSFFKPPPATGELKEPRQPNRLKKQRIPGSTNESAQSSSNSLHATSTDSVAAAPLTFQSLQVASANGEITVAPSNSETTRSIPGVSLPTREGGHQHQASESTLKPNPRSRTPSVHSRSSFTDHSDLDQVDDAAKNVKKEHRQSWRFALSPRRPILDHHDTLAIPSNAGAEFSSSSIGSSGRQRRSSANGSQPRGTDASHMQDSDLGSNVSLLKNAAQPSEPEKRSLFGKFKAKVAHMKEGVKEREAERERAKSPPQSDTEKTASSQNLPLVTKDYRNGRRVSIDHSRESIEDPSSPPPLATPTSPPAIPEEEPPSTISSGQDPGPSSNEPAPAPQLETEESTASSEFAVREAPSTPNPSQDSSVTTASTSELKV